MEKLPSDLWFSNACPFPWFLQELNLKSFYEGDLVKFSEEDKPLFRFEGKDLFHTYALYGDIEIVKGMMYASNQGIFAPKAAMDYFVEETFKKFMDKLQEQRQSLFAKGVKE